MGIEELDRGLRRRYFDYATLTAQLHAWIEAYPGVSRLRSLGESPEGRSIWLLSIGADLDSTRPGVWVDANMHGGEFSGTHVALAIAEAALRLHTDDADPAVADALLATLRRVHFHVCPRISPDGAEAALHSGAFVRSIPRTRFHDPDAPHWRREDVDGDGTVRYIRRRDPAGQFVESGEVSGVMLPRRPEDPPPYYQLFPEGTITGFDGDHVPDPEFLTGTTDLNRNFPHDWRPEPEQPGAGAYPAAEPESAAVVAWVSGQPSLFAWLNLHTFGGVFIRPPGDTTDSRMNQSDRRLYRQLAAWSEAIVGYPTVNGYEEFTYEPEKPLHGDLTDYAYHQRGCLAEVCELWDIFVRAALPQPRPFVERYTALSRADVVKLARWDREHNEGRIFRDWTVFDHPQLGPIEIGGADPRVGIWNPPYEVLPEVCDAMTRYWLHVAALLPRIELVDATSEAVGDDLWRVAVTVANRGYMPTWGVDAARELPFNTPLYAHVTTAECELTEPTRARVEIGHLAGWGRGQGHGADTPWFARSDGTHDRCRLRWHVRGAGRIEVSVGNARVGWCQARIDAGD